MQEAVREEMHLISAGPVEFGIDYRSFAGDEGLAIHVYGDVNNHRTELMRFDCFRDEPHYHYGPDGKNEAIDFDYTANGPPITWALERLYSRLIPMLVRAGYPDIASEVELNKVEMALPQVEAWAYTIAQNRGFTHE